MTAPSAATAGETQASAPDAVSGSDVAETESTPLHEATLLPLARSTRLRGAALALFGVVALLAQHALSFQVPHGGLLGLVSTLVATFGALLALGFLQTSTGDVPVRSTALFPLPGEPWFTAPVVTLPLALGLAVVAAFVTGGAPLPFGVALLIACLVFALSAIRRPALLPLAILTAIYLPRLGDFALWDPWETHYGEVAREMLARDDWISLWWAQERWFWSKPILVFWTEAWSMSALGIDFTPDAHPANLEWALRLPVFVMSLGAVAAIQAFSSRAFGRRAGMLSALVVGSMPHFYLLAHQAITDMPLSAGVSVAVCCLGLALIASADELPVSVRVGPFALSSRAAVAGTVIALALPQITYLFTRNLRLDGRGLVTRLDKFLEGSAGNFGVPGNPAYVDVLGPSPVQPAAQGALWLAVLGVVLAFLVRIRTKRDVAMIGFYVACAFGLVGKGIPGVALPGLVALLYLVVSGRWGLLTSGALRVWNGVFIVLLLGLPWYVAMTLRHGRGFLDRIVVHDHINRLATGVHGDNGPIEYFLAQLGFGTFPWVGLVPVAVLAFLYLGRSGESSPEREGARLVGLWALAAFTLFNAMVTKFHHYIFPVVPPAGLLVGVVLDRLVGRDRRDAVATVFVTLGTLGAVLGVAGAYGNVRGVLPPDAPRDFSATHGLPIGVWVAMLLGAAVLIGYAARRLRRDPEPITAVERGLAAAALGGACLAAFVGRDTSWVTSQHPHGQERFAQLFIYMYSRPFPEYLDYRPIFTGFAVVAVAALAFLALRPLRQVALRMALVSSLALAAFSVNVYLPDVAQHWSTKGLVNRYYAQRHGSEPLLAFQMNWKGENLYTGNRVHVFQDLDTSTLRNWLAEHRGESMYLLVEHSRLEAFKGLLPAGSRVQVRSTMRDNNKFVLTYVRVAPPSS